MSWVTYILGAPLWVWPLLAGLVAVGLRSMRQRVVPAWLVYALPLLVLITLIRLISTQAPFSAWAAFLSSYAVGSLWGYRLQKRFIIDCQAGRVKLRGEAFTLLTFMIIFWGNFGHGVLHAVRPDIAAHALYMAFLFAPIGLFAGTLLGRAVRVARCAARSTMRK